MQYTVKNVTQGHKKGNFYFHDELDKYNHVCNKTLMGFVQVQNGGDAITNHTIQCFFGELLPGGAGAARVANKGVVAADHAGSFFLKHEISGEEGMLGEGFPDLSLLHSKSSQSY